MEEKGLPLGIMRTATAKIDSAISDIHECIEDPDTSESTKHVFEVLAETLCNVEAHLVNIASAEMSEEDFIAETVPMDFDEAEEEEPMDIMDEEL